MGEGSWGQKGQGMGVVFTPKRSSSRVPRNHGSPWGSPQAASPQQCVENRVSDVCRRRGETTRPPLDLHPHWVSCQATYLDSPLDDRLDGDLHRAHDDPIGGDVDVHLCAARGTLTDRPPKGRRRE